MGMFDWVSIKNRDDITCPAGHDLTVYQLQTKDLENSGTTHTVDGDVVTPKLQGWGDYGDGVDDHGNGVMHVYHFCEVCHPRYVDGVYQRDHGDLHTFRLTLTNWWVVDVKRVRWEDIP